MPPTTVTEDSSIDRLVFATGAVALVLLVGARVFLCIALQLCIALHCKRPASAGISCCNHGPFGRSQPLHDPSNPIQRHWRTAFRHRNGTTPHDTLVPAWAIDGGKYWRSWRGTRRLRKASRPRPRPGWKASRRAEGAAQFPR